MFLLDCKTYELKDHNGVLPQYAILSHRWGCDYMFEADFPEVQYPTLNMARPELLDHTVNRPELNKIRGACKTALQHGLLWLWDDTFCINKDDPVGRQTALNSMFNWYRDARICIAYIGDVARPRTGQSTVEVFRSQLADRKAKCSEWFTRGWTLQELLAPTKMEFYSQDWTLIGTRHDLATDIQLITGIDAKYLRDNPDLTQEPEFKKASVATRLSWMAGRTTGQVEDIAYSLFGILNVQMPLLYNEGRKAFMRLQQALLENFPVDESLFAWTHPPSGRLDCFGRDPIPERAPTPGHPGIPGRARIPGPVFSESSWGMLAPSPDCFRGTSDVFVDKAKVVQRGCYWAAEGVTFDMSMKSGSETTNWAGLPRKNITLALNCWRKVDGTDQTVVVQLSKSKGPYQREVEKILHTNPKAKPGTNRVLGIDQMLTRPLVVLQSYM